MSISRASSTPNDVVQVRPRVREINKLVIHENETRNVGVIQHNHRIVEKETRYVETRAGPSARRPAYRVRVSRPCYVPVVMQPVQNCGCPCTCSGSHSAYARAYVYGAGYAYGAGRGYVQQVLVPVTCRPDTAIGKAQSRAGDDAFDQAVRGGMFVRVCGWWSQAGSNRRPPHCERGALPAELRPQPRAHGQWRPASSGRHLRLGVGRVKNRPVQGRFGRLFGGGRPASFAAFRQGQRHPCARIFYVILISFLTCISGC